MKISNVLNEEGMDVNGDNFKKYFDYLNDHLNFSELATGMEDLNPALIPYPLKSNRFLHKI